MKTYYLGHALRFQQFKKFFWQFLELAIFWLFGLVCGVGFTLIIQKLS